MGKSRDALDTGAWTFFSPTTSIIGFCLMKGDRLVSPRHTVLNTCTLISGAAIGAVVGVSVNTVIAPIMLVVATSDCVSTYRHYPNQPMRI